MGGANCTNQWAADCFTAGDTWKPSSTQKLTWKPHDLKNPSCRMSKTQFGHQNFNISHPQHGNSQLFAQDHETNKSENWCCFGTFPYATACGTSCQTPSSVQFIKGSLNPVMQPMLDILDIQTYVHALNCAEHVSVFVGSAFPNLHLIPTFVGVQRALTYAATICPVLRNKTLWNQKPSILSHFFPLLFGSGENSSWSIPYTGESVNTFIPLTRIKRGKQERIYKAIYIKEKTV